MLFLCTCVCVLSVWFLLSVLVITLCAHTATVWPEIGSVKAVSFNPLDVSLLAGVLFVVVVLVTLCGAKTVWQKAGGAAHIRPHF